MCNKRFCLSLFLLAALSLAASAAPSPAADTTVSFRIYYYVDKSDLAPEYMMNSVTMREMDHLLDSLHRADARFNIQMLSGASPEGTEVLNQSLAERRNERIRMHLLTGGFGILSHDISATSMGADWDGLARAVERSSYPWKSRVLLIIRNTPVWVRGASGNIVDSRKKQLMDLQGGQVWREMERDLFPHLRRTEVEISYPLTPKPAPKPQTDTVYIVQHERDTVILERERMVQAPEHKHGFLLYTNLLYDAGAVPSIGTEFYFGGGWALNARWSGSWWSSKPKNRYYRAYGAELALRKYFKLPSDNGAGMFRSSTGHHLGAYGQIFTYDFEFSGKGYMGGIPGKNLFAAPSWSAGLEYGYMFALGRHLNLDLSIGVGYMQGPQYQYTPQDGDYIINSVRTFRWIGPTRADVSLYWLMGFENKKRR